jgi:cation diffusion facilitator CzcD-associated flavoprotein CzcO
VLEWLIIGGGVHGTHLSHLLVHGAGVPDDRLRVLDPHPEPLAVWRRHTARCGMRHLRSPATHHIDLPILSLYRFAQERPSLPTPFIPLYNRPSLELFQAHARAVIQRHDLQRLRITGRALALRRTGGGLVADTSAGEVAARRVLLAVGLGEQPHWPPWAEALHRQGASVDHIFAADFLPLEVPGDGPTVVVGGGITAVQTALAAAARFPGGVTLLSRHDLRPSPYDFDPCWIGPKCLRRFQAADLDERRRAVDEARVRGSVTAEVLAELGQALEAGRLALRRGRVVGAEAREGRVRLQLSDGPLRAGRVVLATGFRSDPPGGPLLAQIIRDFHLPCHACGYPVVGPDLQWGAGIHAAGPLAELALGPCARNIVGARNAGRLLLAAAAQERTGPAHPDL